MVVTPTENGDSSGRPSRRVDVTVTVPVPPVVVGAPKSSALTSAVQPSAVVETGAGQEMSGGGSSVTVTLKLHEPPPVAELTVTVVVPTGKKEPEVGVALTAPQLPKASAEPKLTTAPCVVPWKELATAMMSLGHSSAQAGSAPPPVVTSKLPVPTLLLASSSAVSVVAVAVVETTPAAPPAM